MATQFTGLVTPEAFQLFPASSLFISPPIVEQYRISGLDELMAIPVTVCAFPEKTESTWFQLTPLSPLR